MEYCLKTAQSCRLINIACLLLVRQCVKGVSAMLACCAQQILMMLFLMLQQIFQGNEEESRSAIGNFQTNYHLLSFAYLQVTQSLTDAKVKVKASRMFTSSTGPGNLLETWSIQWEQDKKASRHQSSRLEPAAIYKRLVNHALHIRWKGHRA